MTCPNCYKLVAENAELSQEAMQLAVELNELKEAVRDLADERALQLGVSSPRFDAPGS